jgi:hypothetical protein
MAAAASTSTNASGFSPYLGTSLSLVGAASSAYSAWQSAKFQKKQLANEAELAEINARVAEQGAESALIAGQKQESAIRSRTAQIKSAQRAGLGASGVDLGTGSAANLLTSTDVMGEIDANTAEINAIQSAWGYRTQASNALASAAMSRAASAGISPGSAAFASILSSAPQVAASWYKVNKGIGMKGAE